MDSVLWVRPSENDEHHASKFRHGGTREVEERFVRELGDCDAIQKEQDEDRRRRRLSPRRLRRRPRLLQLRRGHAYPTAPGARRPEKRVGDDFDPTLLNRDKVKQSPEASSDKLTVKTVRGQGQRGEQ